MAIRIQLDVSWVVMPCSGGQCCEGSKVLRNFGTWRHNTEGHELINELRLEECGLSYVLVLL
jgi:hypothetical protein